MELFAYDLSSSLKEKIDLSLIQWGGSNKALPIILPLLLLKGSSQLLTNKIDVIHMQDCMIAPIGYVLSRVFRKPFTVVVHGLDITFKNPVYQAAIPWAVRKADKVFCISQAAADAAIERGVPQSKIQILTLAVADKLHGTADKNSLRQKLELSDDSKILVTVGRLVKRKGVAWFIDEVLPGLVRRYPELIYVVVGEGSQRPIIEAVIEKNELHKNVKMLGRLDDDLYKAAYNGSDIFVMPNINVPGDIEGFGIVLLEASLCEMPVVASNTEGIRDAVKDGSNGVLVPVMDKAAFARAIYEFLDRPNEALKFGKKSRNYSLENYQWSKIADRYISNYKEIVKAKK